MTAIDLSRQLALDADPKTIHQINFTGNLFWGENANITLFLIGKAKKLLDFPVFCFNIILI